MQDAHAIVPNSFAAPGFLAGLASASALETASFRLLIAVLALAPIPLGSNRPWSSSLLALLVGFAWALWAVAAGLQPANTTRLLRRLRVPIVLAVVALAWGAAQMFAAFPRTWTHGIWEAAGMVLGREPEPTISLNAWRTGSELMKLATYAMAAWLAFAMAQASERAGRLLDALIVIATGYAVYALVLAYFGMSQFALFYGERAPSPEIAGPFVSRNNFATYCGLGMLCAWVRLFALGGAHVVTSAGMRALVVSGLQFALGRGWVPLFGGIITFSLLLASASRAGFFAALVGATAILTFAGALALRHARSRWPVFGAITLIAAAFLLFSLNGGALQSRLFATFQDGQLDEVRIVLWQAASRMIADAPLSGLGLGTFEAAYPLYADRLLPFTLDKAHNDFLELAAGWGLPAACLWWIALLWLAALCVRGIFLRRRDRAYPLLAAGATMLVATHSLFDFSLQIPAVAMTYAVMLGLGVAQSFSTRAA